MKQDDMDFKDYTPVQQRWDDAREKAKEMAEQHPNWHEVSVLELKFMDIKIAGIIKVIEEAENKPEPSSEIKWVLTQRREELKDLIQQYLLKFAEVPEPMPQQ